MEKELKQFSLKEEHFKFPFSEFDLDVIRVHLKNILPNGEVTLSSGTATVREARCSRSSMVFVTAKTFAGTPGLLSAQPNDGYFTITSQSSSDASVVRWFLIP